jgi:hypothetical protein
MAPIFIFGQQSHMAPKDKFVKARVSVPNAVHAPSKHLYRKSESMPVEQPIKKAKSKQTPASLRELT